MTAATFGVSAEVPAAGVEPSPAQAARPSVRAASGTAASAPRRRAEDWIFVLDIIPLPWVGGALRVPEA